MIELSHISKVYQRGDGTPVPALRDISLRIARGEFVTIRGASGSGKSSLLNILGCLDTPSEGSYRLNGEDVSRYTDEQRSRLRSRSIGFVFQSFNLLPRTSAIENVEVPALYTGERVDRARARRLLERVGLGHRADHYVTELSGGEQQRVAIARALAMEPRTLLMDEPLSNLDASLREEMRFELRRLHEAHGVTTLYVTHDQAEAMATADLVAVMDHGRIAQLGTPEALYAAPANAFVARFLGGTNLIPGRHLGGAVVACGPLRFACAGGEAGQGGAALVAIRPHAIRLAAGPGENVVPARLLRATFLGPVRDLAVEIEGGASLRITVPADQPLPEDGALMIALPREACRMLPDERAGDQRKR